MDSHTAGVDEAVLAVLLVDASDDVWPTIFLCYCILLLKRSGPPTWSSLSHWAPGG